MASIRLSRADRSWSKAIRRPRAVARACCFNFATRPITSPFHTCRTVIHHTCKHPDHDLMDTTARTPLHTQPASQPASLPASPRHQPQTEPADRVPTTTEVNTPHA